MGGILGRGGRYDGHIMGGKRGRQGEGAYSGRGGLVGIGMNGLLGNA